MKLIIISGPSGSGKTTLSKKILRKYMNGIVLSTDNYYKTGIISKALSKLVVSYFERKISFNFRLFNKDFNYIIENSDSKHNYSYDFKNKKIKKSLKKTNNIEFLIVEGIFSKEILSQPNKKNCFFIELRTSKDSCMKRVINRDVNERGKIKEHAEIDFLKSWDFYYRKNNQRKKIENELILTKTKDIYLILNQILNLKN